MTHHHWLRVNRGASRTWLVIPGWSLLPSYVAQLIPNQNLVVLNPFMTPQVCQTQFIPHALADASVDMLHAPIQALSYDHVCLFSMGYQWAMVHAPEWVSQPHVFWSCVARMHPHALTQLKQGIATEYQSALTRFYRAACSSLSMWRWWRTHGLVHHIQYNTPAVLIEWLDTFGPLSITAPPHPDSHWCIDPADPIGVRPTPVSGVVHHHGHGHLIPPQAMADVLPYPV